MKRKKQNTTKKNRKQLTLFNIHNKYILSTESQQKCILICKYESEQKRKKKRLKHFE